MTKPRQRSIVKKVLISAVSGVERIVHSAFRLLSLIQRSRNVEPIRGSRSILLKHLGAIGDHILFTATLPAYRILFPGAKLTLLVRSEVREIAESNPNVDRVISLNLHSFRRSLLTKFRLWHDLVAEKFDHALNLDYSTHYDHFDRAIFTWANAPIRVAFECLDEDANRDYSLYTTVVPQQDRWLFEIDRNNLMVKYFGTDYDAHTTEVAGIHPDARDQFVERLLRNRPYYVVCPGSLVRDKCWPTGSFAALINRIDLPQFVPVLCGSMKDKSVAAEIESLLTRRALSTVGTTTLLQLAYLISKSAFVVSNESAPAHIAAALGVPCFVILGGGDFGRFMPYPYSSSLFPIYDTTLSEFFRCGWHCHYSEWKCVANISVESVLRAISQNISHIRKVQSTPIR